MRKPKSFRRKSKGEIILHLFVSLVFALVAASYLYLVLWPVMSGFKTHTEIVMDPFGLPKHWNWKNFLDVFTMLKVNGSNFWNMLFNSLSQCRLLIAVRNINFREAGFRIRSS